MNELVEVTDDPVPEEVIAYCKSHSASEEEFEEELAAFRDFVERYRKERNRNKRIVMENFLQYLLFDRGHDMKPSYALVEALEDPLRDEKDAQKAIYPLPLHQGIAEIFTSNTHTKGRGKTTNWKMHTGNFYSNFNGEGRSWFEGWNAQEVLGSYVKFGSHRFAVGSATQRILNLIEQRYGLDFKELEKQRGKRK